MFLLEFVEVFPKEEYRIFFYEEISKYFFKIVTDYVVNYNSENIIPKQYKS